MFRRKNVIAVIAVIVLIPVAAIAWWLVAPLFMNTTVEEEFPLAFAASVPPDMTMAGVEQIMAGMAKVDQEVDEAMPEPKEGEKPSGMANDPQLSDAMTGAVMDAMSETMIEAMTKATIDSMPGDMPEEMKKEMAQAMPEAMKEVMAQAMPDAMKEVMAKAMPETTKSAEITPPSPVKLKAGEFSGVDRFHKGSGRAAIYRLPDGSGLLRLEDFNVTNGPDLRVILTPAQDPGGPGEVTAPGHVELAKLKGNNGNQNYEIPADADLASFRSVVIYCKPFRVIFSIAPLQDAG